MGTLENIVDIVDPDEMPHDVAFHQGMHCLLLTPNSIFRERYSILFFKL